MLVNDGLKARLGSSRKWGNTKPGRASRTLVQRKKAFLVLAACVPVCIYKALNLFRLRFVSWSPLPKENPAQSPSTTNGPSHTMAFATSFWTIPEQMGSLRSDYQSRMTLRRFACPGRLLTFHFSRFSSPSPSHLSRPRLRPRAGYFEDFSPGSPHFSFNPAPPISRASSASSTTRTRGFDFFLPREPAKFSR
jgi:hypothetical protein